MKKTLLAVLMVLMGSAVFGATYEEGKADYDRRDYPTAAKILREFAEQGLADAQCILGSMYNKGKGVPRDRKEAVKWYLKAAEQGHAGGQRYLGLMYENGYGVPQDYKEAAKWYLKAAEQGHAGGQCNLGVMYANGDGVPQNVAEAYFWLNLAAAREPELAELRNKVSAKLTPAKREEVQARCKKWLEDFEKRKTAEERPDSK